jgi:hypothetical protein
MSRRPGLDWIAMRSRLWPRPSVRIVPGILERREPHLLCEPRDVAQAIHESSQQSARDHRGAGQPVRAVR